MGNDTQLIMFGDPHFIFSSRGVKEDSLLDAGAPVEVEDPLECPREKVFACCSDHSARYEVEYPAREEQEYRSPPQCVLRKSRN